MGNSKALLPCRLRFWTTMSVTGCLGSWLRQWCARLAGFQNPLHRHNCFIIIVIDILVIVSDLLHGESWSAMVEGRVMVTAEGQQLWNSLTGPMFRSVFYDLCWGPCTIMTHRNHHRQQYYHTKKSIILFSGWNSLFWSISWLREGISQWTGDTCCYDDDTCWYDVDIMMIWWGCDDDMMTI